MKGAGILSEPATHKVCSQCQVTKPLFEFHKNKSGKFGRRSNRKRCVSSNLKSYHAQPDIKKRRSAYMNAYRDDPKVIKREKQYRKFNKEQLLKRKREYSSRPDIKRRRREYLSTEDVSERVREYRRRYYKHNPDKIH